MLFVLSVDVPDDFRPGIIVSTWDWTFLLAPAINFCRMIRTIALYRARTLYRSSRTLALLLRALRSWLSFLLVLLSQFLLARFAVFILFNRGMVDS